MFLQKIGGAAERWACRAIFLSLLFVLLGVGRSSGLAAVNLVATSSNPALLPESNIRVEWSGQAYTVTFAPRPEPEGSATVRLAVTDGVTSAPLRPDFVQAGIEPPPPNTAPRLSDLANHTFPAGTEAVTVPFDISDSELPADALTVKAFADNASLLPDANISIDGTNGSRTLILRLIVGQTGSTVVSVRLSDGEFVSTRSFVLTVVSNVPPPPPPNTAPFISEITNHVFASTGEYIHLPFTIDDAETPVANLTAHAVGDNPALISEPNMFVYGTTTNRLLVARLPINQAGTVNVVVRVSDGELTSTRTFALTITGPPPNRPPFISSIAAQTISADAESINVPFTIGDLETAADLLTLSAQTDDPEIVPAGNLSIFGNGANRTLIVRRAAGAIGDTTVSVTVDDGEHSAVTIFDVTVAAKAPPPNTAPFIGEIANQVFASTGEYIHLPFTIGDAETAVDDLTAGAVGDNPALISESNIFVHGTTTNRLLVARLPLNQAGTINVSVSVSDGQLTSARSFKLTVVKPPNRPPFISSIAAQTIPAEAEAISIPFTVGDVETAAETLTLSAQTDDPEIVPAGNLSIFGNGANRTLIVRRAAGAIGDTTVSVTVDDGEHSAVTIFDVTVAAKAPPPNTAPFIGEIANQVFASSGEYIHLPFTIGDAETAVDDLTAGAVGDNPALISESNIFVHGTTTNRLLVARLPLNQAGAINVSVSVSDGELTSARSFKLTVAKPPNRPPVISSIAAQTISADADSINLPFTIGDAETSADALRVSMWTDDPEVVPAGNLSLLGNGANRTLIVRREAGVIGDTTVSVSVSDGEHLAVTIFNVTVAAKAPPPNTAPFIGEITNQVFASTGEYIHLPFTIGDVETAVEDLIADAVGDNPALISESNMFVYGTTTNRLLVARLPINQDGTVNVVVRVSDGELTSTRSFTLTITGPPPNRPPFISSIPVQTIPAEDESISIPFTIGDGETAADALTVSMWTDDPEIVPDENLSIFGNGAHRTLIVHRKDGVVGDTTVSVMVDDREHSTVTTFHLTVVPKAPPLNTAPFISSVANQTIEADGEAISISLNLGDAESPANALDIEAWADDASLIPDGNISIDGSGAARTLVLRPALNRTGSTTLDLSVSDGELTTITSFVVTITPEEAVDNQLRIQSIRRTTATGITLTWSSEAGQVYQVLAKDRVDQTYWSIISLKLVAYGSSLTWTDLSTMVPSRIYQIRKLPTLLPAPSPPPRFVGVSPTAAGGVELRWTGQPGASYRVLAKERLGQPDWIPVSGELMAEGAGVSWIDRDAWGFASRFYQIELRP